MSILTVGLNHRTAPVELREQLALADCGLRMALEELALYRHQPGQAGGRTNGNPHNPHEDATLQEVAILSTCNRLEIYGTARDPALGGQAVEHFLSGLQGIPLDRLAPHLYHLRDQAAITHLMRVAAGLDSMVLGEPQILGQVSQAFGAAQSAGVVGPILSHLFAQAIHAGKRARTETAISRYTTSISHMAVLLVREHVGDLARANVLVVGAGDMAEQAVKALQHHDARSIACINRTFSRAQALARRIEGRAFNWYHLADALTWADVVITATGAPHLVIYREEVAEMLPRRGGRPLLFVDIALPRDVEETVSTLPGVLCRDIDDLQAALDESLAQRQAAVPAVETIVEEEALQFWEWLQGRQVVPVIVELRRKAAALARDEVAQALRRLDGLDDREQKVVAQLAHRLVNKILHEPTIRLKAHAADGDGHNYAHVVRELFALDEVKRET